MSCILNIETSTSVCSVAASQDGQTIFVKEDLKGPSHAVSLGVFVDEALSFIDSHAIPLDAVAVSCGPGSYTDSESGFLWRKEFVTGAISLDRYPDAGSIECSGAVVSRLARKRFALSDDRRPPHGSICSRL